MSHARLSRTSQKFLTWLLSLALVGGTFPVPALAEMAEESADVATVQPSDQKAASDEADPEGGSSAVSEGSSGGAESPDVPDDFWLQEHPTGGMADPMQVPSVFDGDEEADLRAQASLPAEYYSDSYGCITPVRDQTPFETCWAFSTIAAIEASMLKRGPSMGYTASTLDLSERHLAYFTFNLPQDPLHNTDGDKMLPRSNESALPTRPPCYLNNGGNNLLAATALWSWSGAVTEDVAPYSALQNFYYGDPGYDYTTLLAKTALSSSLGRKGTVRLKNMRMINMTDISEVKRAVMEYGAASVGMMWADSYYSYDIGSFYYYYNGKEASNHGVTIVGWKDGIDRERFGKSYAGARPKKGGAWLIKNSWGSDRYDGGYFWLSYEDTCLLAQNAYVFEVEQDGLYNNLYQYDGTPSGYLNYIEPGGSIANVFEAKANAKGEQLKAVSFFLPDVNVSYSCQVYLDPTKENDPTSGVAALSKPLTGTMTNAGIVNLELPSAITLAPGVKFSVVVTLKRTKGSDRVMYEVDATTPSDYWYRTISAVTPGQSFERDTATAAWEDLATITEPDPGDEPKCCARIKAYTTNYNMGSALKLSNATVTVDPQGYTGKAVTPNPKVVIANHTLRKGVDYTLAYKNNVNVGTATVTVKGKGSYSGSKSATFEIRRFADVASTTSHVDDILWLADTGISEGWLESDGTRTFRPKDPVKRGDMAAFLFRLAKRWGAVSESWQPTGATTFDDVTAKTSHRREILWLAETGISKGWEVGARTEFRPKEGIKRCEMAAFMYRLAYVVAGRRGSAASAASFFRDVTMKTSFHDEIWWLAGNGVTQGWPVGSAREYRPYDTVRRGDMAAFLHRLDDVR